MATRPVAQHFGNGRSRRKKTGKTTSRKVARLERQHVEAVALEVDGLRRPAGERVTRRRPRRRASSQVATEGRDRVLPPNWMRAMIERGTDERSLLDEALGRLRRSGSKKNLLLVHCLLRGIGRRPGGAAVFNEVVTRDLVRDLAGGTGS